MSLTGVILLYFKLHFLDNTPVLLPQVYDARLPYYTLTLLSPEFYIRGSQPTSARDHLPKSTSLPAVMNPDLL